MNRRLLLISNSTEHGRGYLDHCAEAMLETLGASRSVLFVPFALADRDAYARKAAARFEQMGVACSSLHEATDPQAAIDGAAAVFVGGGNTFRLLSELYRLGLIERIRDRVAAGMVYMGASAGTNIACPTIRTTNDMPIVEPPSLDAIRLVPFQINPHYIDPPPDSTHMGETRETRIREYLEENRLPVVGLREGSWLEVDGSHCRLGGQRPARLFARDAECHEFSPGSDLAELLGADLVP